MRRTFNAGEIAKILSSQKLNDHYALDLGNGLIAYQTAAAYKDPKHPSFLLERNGQLEGNLEDMDEATLKELSEILWEKISPQFGMSEKEKLWDELMPENLTGEDDEDIQIPDELRATKDPAERALEDLLLPSRLIDIIQNPGLARKLADGTATERERLESELMPDQYAGEPEEGKTLEDQLLPDRFKDEVDPAVVKKVVPTAKADLENLLTPDNLK